MSATRLSSFAVASAVALASATAFADQPADPPVERSPNADPAALFAEGRQRYDEGRFEEALGLFRRAIEAAPSPNARLYIGRSLRRLGRLAEAYNELRRTAQEANRRAATEPRYQSTRESARDEAAALVSSVAFVTLQVSNAPTGAEVTIDGQRTGPALWTQPLARMPGRAHIEARADGMQPITVDVDLRAGSETRVRIPFAQANLEGAVQMGFANDPPQGGSQGVETVAVDRRALDASMGERSGGAGPQMGPTQTPPERPAPSAWVAVGATTLSLGVASSITGIVFAVLGSERFGTLSAQCNRVGSTCHTDAAVQRQVSEGRTFDLVASVTIAAGATATVAGVAMMLGGFAQNEANRSAATILAPAMVRVVPTGSVTTDGATVGVRGTF
ncbi:MAG: tetratricopeptide repeat protein [Myxococcales bacterium]|nr:tetratricopeptide repeat protein [Myxococcales bacterium]